MDIELMHEQGELMGEGRKVNPCLTPRYKNSIGDDLKRLTPKDWAAVILTGGTLLPGALYSEQKKAAYNEGDAYNEAKAKYSFDDGTTCDQLYDLSDKIGVEIEDQQRKQTSSSVQKKDRKVQATAEAGYTRRQREITDQIKKLDCVGKKRSSEDEKQKDDVLDSITAAQTAAIQAAQGVTSQNAAGAISKTMMYVIGGVSLLIVVLAVVLKKKHPQS